MRRGGVGCYSAGSAGTLLQQLEWGSYGVMGGHGSPHLARRWGAGAATGGRSSALAAAAAASSYQLYPL